MDRSERFGLTLTPVEKVALHRLADKERISAAAVVRRLIWREARNRGLIARADEREREITNDQ